MFLIHTELRCTVNHTSDLLTIPSLTARCQLLLQSSNLPILQSVHSTQLAVGWVNVFRRNDHAMGQLEGSCWICTGYVHTSFKKCWLLIFFLAYCGQLGGSSVGFVAFFWWHRKINCLRNRDLDQKKKFLFQILLFLFWQQNKRWKRSKAHLDLLKYRDLKMCSYLKLYQYLPKGLLMQNRRQSVICSSETFATDARKRRLVITMPQSLYLLTYLLTYLPTPWCRVLLEKLTGLQLVKKFPAFHGTRRFITALTSVRHLSLSWASPI